MRLLLAEDDRMIGDSLRQALRLEGHAVDWVYDVAAAQAALAAERFDLLLLDLGLPARAGLGAEPSAGLVVLRSLRGRGDTTPVIVLTARDATEVNRVKAMTRCGMGRCQGRVCGPALQEIVAGASGQDGAGAGRLRGQAPVKPIALSAAGESTP